MQETQQTEMGNGEWGMGNFRPAHPASKIPIRHSAFPIGRAAFTLTELLVVIAIIAVLAALITAAARRAFVTGTRARVVLEIKNMSGSMENFKNDYGSYPPSAVNEGKHDKAGTSGVSQTETLNDFKRMFKRAFTRMDSQEEVVVRALSGENMPSSGNARVTSPQLIGGINAEEAIVFWLGGFGADAQFPLSSKGGPSFDVSSDAGEVLEDRQLRYEFDLGRLMPRDETSKLFDGRYIAYSIDLNHDGDASDVGEERRINLWEYAPKGLTKPYVYFDVSRYKPYQYDPAGERYDPADLDVAKLFAIKQLRQGKTTATTFQDLSFVNAGKFQILHAGLDDVWGTDFGGSASSSDTNIGATAVGNMILYPSGPFIGDPADTLTNFTDGELAAEQESE